MGERRNENRAGMEMSVETAILYTALESYFLIKEMSPSDTMRQDTHSLWDTG